MNKQITIFALVLLTLALLRAALPTEAAPTATRTVCSFVLCDFSTIQAAINASSDGDVIVVGESPHVEGNIVVNKDVTITGSGILSTNVSAAGLSSRVFEIATDSVVTIRDLGVWDGQADHGTLF